ncbi:2-nitropropane dioxygenase [Polaromonas sp.]|nr:2-nitropropane dioxygenase [Polaromonas sp.]
MNKLHSLPSHTSPFKLRLPVFAAPMFLISGPDLVLAACKAGIVGAFPTPNARPIDMLETWMKQITEGLARARDEQPAATIGPWCANLITHSSNTRLPEDLALIAKYKPPIVVTALGSPKPAIEVVQGYGGLVFADVINIKLAKKAVAAGADGLACVSAGAGGHTGSLSPFAFVSALRDFFDGHLVVGGGISDGWGVAGAIASGADYVYMGTRFIPVTESLAHTDYKQMVVDSTVDDLIVSAGITGTAASWLKPSLRALGIDPDNMPAAPERHYDSNQPTAARKWVDVWAAGQGLGTIRAIEPVAAVVDRLEQEYRMAVTRMAGMPYAGGPPSAAQKSVAHAQPESIT